MFQVKKQCLQYFGKVYGKRELFWRESYFVLSTIVYISQINAT